MKRKVATFLLISTFTIVPSMPASAAESTELMDESVFMEEGYVSEAAAFKPCPSGTYKVRRHTRTKKKLLNAAITSGIGAAIGAGVGGGRGALIGAGAGAGGYLTYRYIRDKRGRCVRRYS
jgi:hypothetical protein